MSDEIEELENLAIAATNSGREMAEELGGRIGVKRLVEIWERHNDDLRAWIVAGKDSHDRELASLRAENERLRSRLALKGGDA